MMRVVVILLMISVMIIEGTGQAPIVKTKQGYVSGIVEQSLKGKTFYSYYGIPYAKPPIGPLRFKDPEPADKWMEMRDGSVMPDSCIQLTFEPFMTDQKPQDKDFIGKENCLYVNIFTPKPRDDRQNLPVMVWFHGGGFFYGGANEYLPHALMEHDVVLVVVQYRLGIFGFMSTEDQVMPGNLGLKDQTQALQWIHKNIDHFGGDKKQVTIFGESAGGASVTYQMLTPASKGLFSRVIAQSGNVLCPWAITHTAANTAKKVAKALSCPTDQGSQKMLTCLQVLDERQIVKQIYDLFEWNVFPLLMAPRVDGVYLPAEPGQLIREGKIHDVDFMSGVTKDEGAFASSPAFAFDHDRTAVKDNFSVIGPISLGLEEDNADKEEIARDVYQYYVGTTDINSQNIQQFTQMLSDIHFKISHDLITINHAAVSPTKKTFSYELIHKGQLSLGNFIAQPNIPTEISKNWVSHADDLFYLFTGGPLLSPPLSNYPQDLTTPDDLQLRDVITKMWTNFAATGHPTPDATLGFIWEPTTPNSYQHLALTTNPKMIPDNRQKVRNFISSLPTPSNKALHPFQVVPTTLNKDEL